MNDIFLGKPDSKTEDFIKDQWCDIFIKDDGTKVRPAYDATKAMVNLYAVEDYENVKQFSFGKSYTEIVNLYYYDKSHSIDLSRTKIERFSILDLSFNSLTSFSLPDSLASFNNLYLDSNSLTSFSLPDSLESFSHLTIADNNSLTSFSLPDSLASFNNLQLDNNSLTSFSLPDSLESFSVMQLDNICDIDCTACTSVPTIYSGIYDYNSNIWQGTVLVKDAAQKAAFVADKKWNKYNIEVKS